MLRKPRSGLSKTRTYVHILWWHFEIKMCTDLAYPVPAMSSARRPLRESSVNRCHVVSNSSVGTVKSILGVSQRENIQAGQAPTGATSSNTFKSLPAILSRKRKADSDLNAMTVSQPETLHNLKRTTNCKFAKGTLETCHACSHLVAPNWPGLL